MGERFRERFSGREVPGARLRREGSGTKVPGEGFRDRGSGRGVLEEVALEGKVSEDGVDVG